MKTFKKLAFLLIVLTLSLGSVSLSFAKQDNHGQYVSEVAKSTEPGPEHGKTVSEAARNKSHNDHALSFDGVDDNVIVPDNDIFDFRNSSFTIEAWIRTTDLTGYFISKHLADVPAGYNLVVSPLEGGRNVWEPFPLQGYSIEAYLIGKTVVVDNLWHYVAVVMDFGNGIHSLYIDGKLEDSENIPEGAQIRPNDMPLLFGGLMDPSQRNYYNYTGQIDEVRIWNKALTQEEIQANMYREIQAQDGLVGYWQFDEGSGNIAYDSSGNGNHGTLVNGPTWTTDTPF